MTLTGSIAAFIKLANLFKGKELFLPMREHLNIPLSVITLLSLYSMLNYPSIGLGVLMLSTASVTSCLLGWNVIFNIGAADMPVAITVLNSYSGWALCAEGFML